MVKVFDVTNDSENLIMYGHDNEDGDMALKHVSRLDFGDPFRKHEMMCRYVCKDNVLFVNQDTRKRVLSLVFMIIVFVQISTESSNFMVCAYYCVLGLCDWIFDRIHDLRRSHSHC